MTTTTSLLSVVVKKRERDQRTDRPTDRPTNGWTDTPSYRDARTHLKIVRKGRRIDSALQVRDAQITNTIDMSLCKGFVASSIIGRSVDVVDAENED